MLTLQNYPPSLRSPCPKFKPIMQLLIWSTCQVPHPVTWNFHSGECFPCLAVIILACHSMLVRNPNRFPSRFSVFSSPSLLKTTVSTVPISSANGYFTNRSNKGLLSTIGVRLGMPSHIILNTFLSDPNPTRLSWETLNARAGLAAMTDAMSATTGSVT
ncbi:hypothetical protein K504DRAFT_250300 [Pleomassaria siparia CBS 279.74]|uniref:Uncharacterized protein n=1 Tax=Pleomassaria siparia CBS 279.74 TaxID=1314801 RepID=A0A6G1KCH8_9PLEO|nr:hypothetical protein K504DRAFT_250300 [Pleomassaria siparia CBS 279.74]